MIFAILPVKNPKNAKQRLKGFLAVEQRETLARLLYRQTLAALGQAEGIDRVVVVTSDVEVAEHARCSGALVFEEDEQVSHSASALGSGACPPNNGFTSACKTASRAPASCRSASR